MRLVLLALCVSTLETSFGNPLPSIDPASPDKVNVTSKAVQNVKQPKQEKAKPKFDPKDNLSMDKISFIMYAGRVISTLNADPKYEEMKEKLKDPGAADGTLLNLMAMMSEKTTTKLNKLKAEELQRLEKKKCPKEDSRPNYLDFDTPEKFNWIDLHLVISKVTTMRSILEKFIQGKPTD